MTKESHHVLRITPAKKGKLDLGRFRVAYHICGHSGPFIICVNGAEDQLLDNSDLLVASKLIPDSEVRIIPDAGHFLHLERPEILDIYGEYLKEHVLKALKK